MPRMMSFSATHRQLLNGTKSVTRRKGWAFLRPGEVFWAVEKAMGLRPGERVKRLALLRCLSVRREPLSAIDGADVVLEGFPQWSPDQFVEFFTASYGGGVDQLVTRIEFGRAAEHAPLLAGLL